jgi:hypothetical protein
MQIRRGVSIVITENFEEVFETIKSGKKLEGPLLAKFNKLRLLLACVKSEEKIELVEGDK